MCGAYVCVVYVWLHCRLHLHTNCNVDEEAATKAAKTAATMQNKSRIITSRRRRFFAGHNIKRNYIPSAVALHICIIIGIFKPYFYEFNWPLKSHRYAREVCIKNKNYSLQLDKIEVSRYSYKIVAKMLLIFFLSILQVYSTAFPDKSF